MKTDKLSAMANQIAQYFRSYPEKEAIMGIASHLEHFWTPRMLEAMRAQARSGDPTLDAYVIAAMTQPKPPAKNPAASVAVGDLARCDAG